MCCAILGYSGNGLQGHSVGTVKSLETEGRRAVAAVGAETVRHGGVRQTTRRSWSKCKRSYCPRTNECRRDQQIRAFAARLLSTSAFKRRVIDDAIWRYV